MDFPSLFPKSSHVNSSRPPVQAILAPKKVEARGSRKGFFFFFSKGTCLICGAKEDIIGDEMGEDCESKSAVFVLEAGEAVVVRVGKNSPSMRPGQSNLTIGHLTNQSSLAIGRFFHFLSEPVQNFLLGSQVLKQYKKAEEAIVKQCLGSQTDNGHPCFFFFCWVGLVLLWRLKESYSGSRENSQVSISHFILVYQK